MTRFLEQRKKVFAHIFSWVGFIGIITTFLYLENGFVPERLLIAIGMSLIVFYLNYLILVPQFLLKKRTILYVICVLIIVITPIAVMMHFYPIDQLSGNPKFKEFKDFARRSGAFDKAKYIFPVFFNAVFLVVGATIRVYEQLMKNERNKQLIESEKTTTELQFLKNQINPHFLFNSLNSIYSLTIQKSNDAPEAVITLSELMRYMLYQTNSRFVLLKSEIDFIKNYIKLQRLRIVDNKDININVHGIVSNQKIRPLLLISFIENAFKYGTDFKGNTEISIKIYIKENEIQFTCINLIGNRDVDVENSGIGLQNTKNRLQLLYPEKHWLVVKEEENKFMIDLTLKLS